MYFKSPRWVLGAVDPAKNTDRNNDICFDLSSINLFLYVILGWQESLECMRSTCQARLELINQMYARPSIL